jgi:cytidine deaminase
LREDQLSPQIGRLIDAAKAALPASGSSVPAAAVALLTESGAIYTGCFTGEASSGGCRAAALALADHRASLGGDIDAAALAVNLPSDSVFPCPECRRELTAIDPELPLVIKQLGRWVLLPISAVGEAS